MIILTRLGGHPFAVNPDLIERAEVTPDTVITLTDGHKLIVAEPLDEVVRRVRTWRADVTAEAYRMVADAELLLAGRSPDRTPLDANRTDRTDRTDGDLTTDAKHLARLALVTGLGTALTPNKRKES